MERKVVRLCITQDNLEAQMILNVLEDDVCRAMDIICGMGYE